MELTKQHFLYENVCHMCNCKFLCDEVVLLTICICNMDGLQTQFSKDIQEKQARSSGQRIKWCRYSNKRTSPLTGTTDFQSTFDARKQSPCFPHPFNFNQGCFKTGPSRLPPHNPSAEPVETGNPVLLPRLTFHVEAVVP